MKIQIPETEEDTTREKLELELLDLIEQVSEAKQANFLLKYQISKQTSFLYVLFFLYFTYPNWFVISLAPFISNSGIFV